MAKFILFLLIFSISLIAQTPVTDDLPNMTVGVGLSWSRGDVHATSLDVDLAKRIGSTNLYSWSTISTPMATVPAGSQPLASVVTTGAAYILNRSANGAFTLAGIAQGGLSQVQTPATANIASTTSTSPEFTGSLAAIFRIKNLPLHFMIYAKAGNPQKGSDGALVSAILKPGFMLVYTFGK